MTSVKNAAILMFKRHDIALGRLSRLLRSCAAGCLFVSRVAAADLLPVFVTHYPEPGTAGTERNPVASYPQGIYMGGTDGNVRYLIVNCSTEGEVRWARTYQGPGGVSYTYDTLSDLAVDAPGNVYVTGKSLGSTGAYDYATLKLDPQGNTIWVARYDGPKHANEDAVAITVDTAGNSYVTGASSGSYDDYATVKYDCDGAELWVARYASPGNGGAWNDTPVNLAVDPQGNVYVTGNAAPYGSYSYDIVTVKYDSAGVQQWVARYEGPNGAIDLATDIRLAADGCIYVVGTSNEYATGKDFLLLKYAPDGQSLWAARFNSTGNRYDDAGAMVLDGDGNIYVVGTSGSGAGSENGLILVKYDALGQLVWTTPYQQPEREYTASLMALDPVTRKLHIAGTARDSGTNLFDIVTWESDLDGTIHVVSCFDGPLHCGESPRDATLDHRGNFYVSGISNSYRTGYDYIILGLGVATRLEIPSGPRRDPFEIMLVGERERSYALEFSSDLQLWSPLATVVNSNGQTVVKDTASYHAATRFYRARKLPE